MKQQLAIDLTPQEYGTPALLHRAVARKTGIPVSDIAHVEVLRRSLDSRRGHLLYHATVELYCGEEYIAPDYHGNYQDCHHRPAVII
ncbi:MAG: hypothetical protein II555_04655, partial [Bacteroidales bacterium]|nr:hypothetical protein [Bacteroidales bacterium]